MHPTFLDTLISKYDFGLVKLPGLSRNGPLESVVVARTMALQNQWGIAILHFENCLGTKLKTVRPEKLAIPQSRNYNEVSARAFALISVLTFTITIFLLFSSLKRGLASHLTKSVPVRAS